jgi:Family of unknown function (DUF6527)
LNVQVLSAEEMAERNARFRASGLSRDEFELGELATRGTALLAWWPEGNEGRGSFSWLCPGCGSWYYGQLGDQPVSGWDAPRWVNSGTREEPSLMPSLGCANWRRGECAGGHYWLRSGHLEDAL